MANTGGQLKLLNYVMNTTFFCINPNTQYVNGLTHFHLAENSGKLVCIFAAISSVLYLAV